MGGGCSAEILASLTLAKLLLMSATTASAESPGPRSDQSFSVMKACAVFCPWPRKLKPVRNVTVSMLHHLQGPVERCLRRRLHVRGDEALIVDRQEAGRQPHERPSQTDNDGEIDEHQPPGAGERPPHEAAVAPLGLFHSPVEDAEEALSRVMMAAGNLLEQRRA